VLFRSLISTPSSSSRAFFAALFNTEVHPPK
jgi:hypothetical protein